ncbi:MAG: acetyl-CoA carboxylase carboxyl transferase subunit beta [Clostridiaceae bacterium]|nr:acetyl-CoA carboxylase carboxyl transferase subunit beta [Clostridiaceae bacterium]
MDEGYKRIDAPAKFRNPINYSEYEEKWLAAKKNSDSDEAIIFVEGSIFDQACVVGIMDTSFLMGSMGTIVGERIVAAFEYATNKQLPVIIFTASGGARMQEAIHSLMQMKEVSAAVGRFQKAGQLYISVMTDPTTGGVTASFASLGNIILAEPRALIGFAGPRVIKDTIQEELPEGFQRSEHLLEKGFIDEIVERKELKLRLFQLLKFHNNKKISRNDLEEQAKVELNLPQIKKNDLTAFERVKLARDPERIYPAAVVKSLCHDLFELKGDRYFGDDPTIKGGLAYLGNLPITYIYTDKGDGLQGQIENNFGMPHPEGYRKAKRLMEQAEIFGRPILTVIDTPGAYPGIGAENRGQGEAIAQNLRFMSQLSTPVITLITGEAGSGGALALACADRVYMLENAVYTILSPEGFATILWKDVDRVEEAAEVMKLTAFDMVEFGVCDQIFKDDLTGLQECLIKEFSKILIGKTN